MDKYLSSYNLLNKDGSFKIVSIGGGLTAGARDGGLYRNGQLTSFANLIAIQMKTEFKQPFFDEKDFNGFGYKVLSSMSNGVPKYKVVSNNLAILRAEPNIELNPFKGEIDNWSLPFTGFYDWGFDRDIVLNASNPYKSRILLNTTQYGKNNQLYQITNQNFDFFLMESGFDTYLNAILASTTFTSSTANNLTPPNYTQFLKYALSIGAKGVMATIPDIIDFPIAKFILAEDIRKKNQIEVYVRSTSNPNSAVIPIELGSFFLPTPLADSLMDVKIPVSKKRGLSYDNPLLNNRLVSS